MSIYLFKNPIIIKKKVYYITLDDMLYRESDSHLTHILITAGQINFPHDA